MQGRGLLLFYSLATAMFVPGTSAVKLNQPLHAFCLIGFPGHHEPDHAAAGSRSVYSMFRQNVLDVFERAHGARPDVFLVSEYSTLAEWSRESGFPNPEEGSFPELRGYRLGNDVMGSVANTTAEWARYVPNWKKLVNAEPDPNVVRSRHGGVETELQRTMRKTGGSEAVIGGLPSYNEEDSRAAVKARRAPGWRTPGVIVGSNEAYTVPVASGEKDPETGEAKRELLSSDFVPGQAKGGVIQLLEALYCHQMIAEHEAKSVAEGGRGGIEYSGVGVTRADLMFLTPHPVGLLKLNSPTSGVGSKSKIGSCGFSYQRDAISLNLSKIEKSARLRALAEHPAWSLKQHRNSGTLLDGAGHDAIAAPALRAWYARDAACWPFASSGDRWNREHAFCSLKFPLGDREGPPGSWPGFNETRQAQVRGHRRDRGRGRGRRRGRGQGHQTTTRDSNSCSVSENAPPRPTCWIPQVSNDMGGGFADHYIFCDRQGLEIYARGRLDFLNDVVDPNPGEHQAVQTAGRDGMSTGASDGVFGPWIAARRNSFYNKEKHLSSALLFYGVGVRRFEMAILRTCRGTFGGREFGSGDNDGGTAEIKPVRRSGRGGCIAALDGFFAKRSGGQAAHAVRLWRIWRELGRAPTSDTPTISHPAVRFLPFLREPFLNSDSGGVSEAVAAYREAHWKEVTHYPRPLVGNLKPAQTPAAAAGQHLPSTVADRAAVAPTASTTSQAYTPDAAKEANPKSTKSTKSATLPSARTAPVAPLPVSRVFQSRGHGVCFQSETLRVDNSTLGISHEHLEFEPGAFVDTEHSPIDYDDPGNGISYEACCTRASNRDPETSSKGWCWDPRGSSSSRRRPRQSMLSCCS